MPRFSFPKRVRLLKASEFDRVFQTRCSVSDATLIAYGAANELGHARLGLVASRKVGTAVVRNRWKRVIREAFRRVQSDLPAIDLVCLPKSTAPPDVAQLMTALPKLVSRLERKLRRSGQAASSASTGEPT